MNFIKAEKEVFSRMVKGERVCFFPVDEKHIFVTPDGFMGYIFPVSTISFNVSKCMKIEPLKFNELIKPENELTMTYDFRQAGYGDKRMYRRLKGPGKSVFVNNTFLANFQNPRFWQEKDHPTSFITVTETGAAPHQDIPVGIVLPIKTFADWGKDEYWKEGESCG